MDKTLLRRRPSAPMVVAILALFVALGGVGWAATQLPAGSVGTAQLRNGAVTARKLHRGAVGHRQINTRQVQARVGGHCSSASAISSISASGRVRCAIAGASSSPREFGSTSVGITISSAPSTIVTKSLPSGSSYLVLATPYASIAGTVSGQHVQVNCRLTVGSFTGLTRSIGFETGPGALSEQGAIPLVLAAPASAAAQTAKVDCWTVSSSSPAPTVQVISSLNALQTASNG